MNSLQRIGFAVVVGGALAAGGAQAYAQCKMPVLVQPGDTLSAIARRCGVSVEALREVNPRLRIDPNALYVGMAIRMPEGYFDSQSEQTARPNPPPQHDQAPARPENAVHDYVVRSGDTLVAIALRYRISLPELMVLNPGINPLFLRVGQIIRVPGGGSAEPPPPADIAAVSIDPDHGPVGTIVEVEASGFPSDSRLRLTAGPSARDQREIERVRTNRRGRAVVNVRIPDWAADERNLVFRFETVDGRIRTESKRFRITSDGGDREQVNVTGTLTREGVECQAMRGDDGRLYTLDGEFVGLRPGDRVSVRGRIAERSTCMQGITIDVRRIEDAG
jgi:LysM repeat protein